MTITLNYGELNRTDLPKNGITSAGFDEVKIKLASVGRNDLRDVLCELRIGNTEWSKWLITGKGEYVGAWPKRFAKYCYEEHGLKIPHTLMSEIGTILSRHCERGVKSYYWQFCKHMEWNVGNFEGGYSSCWWTDKRFIPARLGIKQSTGGFTVLFYDSPSNFDRYREVTGKGRCVGMNTEQGLVIFNAYGDTSLNKIAQIISTKLGLSYRRVLVQMKTSKLGIYINRGNLNNMQYDGEELVDSVRQGGDYGQAFLIGEESAIAHTSEIDLPDFRFRDGTCSYCKLPIIVAESTKSTKGKIYCDECTKNCIKACPICGEYDDLSSFVEVYYKGKQMMVCSAHDIGVCAVHGKTMYTLFKIWHTNEYYCEECMEKGIAFECDGCGRVHKSGNNINLLRLKMKLCKSCIEKINGDIHA